MLAPVVACLLTMAALGWFGLHVLQRGVIFVDLALAQVAALGATYAVYLGHEPDEAFALLLSLVFTALGAGAFALIRSFEDRVPQEALIGITYAVTAALGVLLVELADDPHGAEKIQHLLVGNIVWVQWSEIAMAGLAIFLVGILHAVLGRRLLTVSFDPEQAERDGMHIGWWDLVFYLSFGVVLTTIVSIVGVLLVFSYLVIPAVIGRLFSDSISGRLAIGYSVGFVVSIVGVAISYEHSTGPIVVGLLGLCLVSSLCIIAVQRAMSPVLRGAQLLAGALATWGVLWAFGQVGGHEESGHDHVEQAVVDHPHEAHHSDHADHDHEPSMNPLTQLEQGVRMAQALDAEGLVLLAELTRTAPPFIRMEADERLRTLAAEAAPVYEPLGAPDTEGLWLNWANSPGDGWRSRAAELVSP
ncbi:MAG: metal ABC transporter permease [Myxococcota bacterium]|nr:metal ABC transporter permease [Myxococcota bacterium]